jgi:hypothetical protein
MKLVAAADTSSRGGEYLTLYSDSEDRLPPAPV